MEAVQLLKEDGVPGAILDENNIGSCNMQQLRRWLECWSLLQAGRKAELVERIEHHIRDKQFHILAPLLDQGVWLNLKTRELLTDLVPAARPQKPCLPIVGWRNFLGYDIPPLFDRVHVFYYAVESIPSVSIHGEEVTVISEEDSAFNQNAKPGCDKIFQRAERTVDFSFVQELQDNSQGNIYFVSGLLCRNMCTSCTLAFLKLSTV